MKYLLIILVAALTFMACDVKGQDRSTILDYDESFWNVSFRSIDTLGTGDSTFVIEVEKRSLKRLLPYAYLSLDSTGGTAAPVNFYLNGKVSDDEPYSPIDTVKWGGTVDTTFSFDVTTATKDRFFEIRAVGTDDVFKWKPSIVDWDMKTD